MKLIVEKATSIEDGKHQGIIVDVQYRDSPYNYTDILIEFNGGLQLKAGYPTKLMEKSKLGLLLRRFGLVIAEGLVVDPNILIGRRCEFITMTEDTPKGSFARVITESVRPPEAEVIKSTTKTPGYT